MSRKIFSFKYLAIVVLTIAVLILGGLNAQQKRGYSVPDDGASWVEGSAGVQARVVVLGGPADKEGINVGDVLKAIDDEPIRNDLHVTQIFYEFTPWQRAKYKLVRHDREIETWVVLEVPEQFLRQQKYLELIGLIYFLVG